MQTQQCNLSETLVIDVVANKILATVREVERMAPILLT